MLLSTLIPAAAASTLTPVMALVLSPLFLLCFAIVAFIAIAILLEFEKEGWATTVFSLSIALLLWNYKNDLLWFIGSNPAATIGFVVSYVVLGIGWSFLKWRSYVKNIFDKFKNLKRDFIDEHKELTIENQGDFNRVLNSNLKDKNGYSLSLSNYDTLETAVDKVTPSSNKKKSVITSWIAYWPASLIATLLNDPFRKFFEAVYEKVSGVYDKITAAYKNDLLKA